MHTHTHTHTHTHHITPHHTTPHHTTHTHTHTHTHTLKLNLDSSSLAYAHGLILTGVCCLFIIIIFFFFFFFNIASSFSILKILTLLVHSGYFGVFILHQSLTWTTWTTGSLTWVCDLFACLYIEGEGGGDLSL